MGLLHSGRSIVTDGLVLCLDAANPRSYPQTGSIWYDLSGKGNNAALSNSPVYNSLGFFSFDGVNDFATITNNSTLDFSSEQTLIMVLRHNYTSGRKNPWDQAYGGYGTWTHEAGNYINQYFGDAGINSVPYVGYGSATTPRDVWNVLSATRNTERHKWYLNDTLSYNRIHSYGVLTTTTANIRLGTGYAGVWIGDMSVVLAYTRALSDSEIYQNFNALRGRFNI